MMSMSKQYCEENLKQIIGKYPNTYTFTKSLTEKNLVKIKGDLNLVILRPSIVAGSWRQPFPGWTDSLAAAGGLTLMAGIGVINYLPCKVPNAPFDMIPVDIVTNCIIVSGAYAGRFNSCI